MIINQKRTLDKKFNVKLVAEELNDRILTKTHHSYNLMIDIFINTIIWIGG